MKIRVFLVKSLMILVSCGVALGIAEIALRVIEPTSDIQLIEINETEFGDYTSLRPNANGLILGHTVSINKRTATATTVTSCAWKRCARPCAS